uniref:Uncharacterized protein n=1 Tax=Cannabis sativa TaxID=3483 RepID=A0A803QL75_CANSA
MHIHILTTMDQAKSGIDPRSGFNSATKIFHSLRPPIDFPPQNLPLSVPEYAFSIHPKWPESVAFINSDTGHRLLFFDFVRRTKTLAANLQTQIGLSKGDVAFVLSPNSVNVPILYFALLTIGVVVSPANPLSAESEIARLVQLCKPVFAFTSSETAHKLRNHRLRTMLIDSPEFDSLTTSSNRDLESVTVRQSDLAAVMFSSGTTGKVKGVMLTHRNVIATIGGYHAKAKRMGKKSPKVALQTVPFFHAYGFFYCAISVAVGDTVVVMMKRFELRKMLGAIEEFRVTNVALVPPIVVALVKSSTDVMAAYNLSSLETVTCGGSPLKKEAIDAFKARFPKVTLTQYPNKRAQKKVNRGLGELWIRGPSIMKGYMGDKEATSAAIDADGWLRTGDLCYIDDQGFLYVVARLKELIKYKAYQVAPAELEQLLQSHTEILDAAVIPYPEEEVGQVPMAIVVRLPKSTLTEAEVKDFVAKQASL